MLITTLFQVQPEGHWVPRDEVGFQSQKPSNSEYNVLSHCVTLLESVLETIDIYLASFFSRIIGLFD